MKKILSVGQCGYDDSRLSRLAQQAGAGFERAMGEEDAVTKIDAGEVGLVLVNRIFDADGSPGIDFVAAVKAQHPGLPVMLVSDYPEAQAKAVAHGAVQGFGKSNLGDPQVVERIKATIAPVATR